MFKKNLSTGEFARLCNTTKATLFYYGKLGLLQPRYVADNGYRSYGIEQYYDFETVWILKETGSSLEEIKRIRDNLEERALLALLAEKRRILAQERKKLELREIMLANIINDLEQAGRLRPDQFMIRDLEDEFLETAPVGANDGSVPESIAAYASYINSREDDALAFRAAFGAIIDNSILAGGSYRELFYFHRTEPGKNANLRRPCGKYLIVAHKGDYASHQDWLRKMGEWCREHDLHPSGEIYGYDLASFLRPKNVEDYRVKYAVRVDAV